MSTVRTERRATYYLPGSLFPEEITRPIDNGPDIVDRAAAQAPTGTFCFVLSTVLTADPVSDGRGGTLAVQPKTIDKTGRYYLGGRLFDQDEVAALGDSHRTVLANMQGNRWALVILTSQGNWQPFEDPDVLLAAVAR